MMLETIAELFDTLGIASYDPTGSASEIWFGDVPEELENIFGLHTGDGPRINLGVNKNMNDFPKVVRVFFQGNDDYYPSYEKIKTAWTQLHGLKTTGINHINVESPDVIGLGRNPSGKQQFTFTMTVHFSELE